jgi:hypothetical protein
MKFCIHSTLKACHLSDLEIIAQYYFYKFIKIENGIYIYNTGFVHDKAVFINYDFQIHERIFLKGIIALITGKYPEFCFESYCILKESNETIVRGFPQHLGISPRPDLNYLTHNKIDAAQIYIKAINDPDLKWILVLFAQQIDDIPFIGWANLYSIYEIIGKDILSKKAGKIKDLLAAELKIEKRKLENFTLLANNSRDPFEGMRHGEKIKQQGVEKFNKLYEHPGALVWASDFIRELTIKWIYYKHNIKIVKPTRDNSAYGFYESGEPLGLISTLEEYEAKHYSK